MNLLHVGLFDNNEPQFALRAALKSISNLYEEIVWRNRRDTNELILANANRFDVVFMQIQTPNIIQVNTVKTLKEKEVLVFNFTGDVRQPLPQWYIDLAPYVITLFTNYNDVELLQSLGYDARYFQIGYDNNIYYPKESKKQPNYPDIVFMGNHYEKMFPLSDFRKQMVDFLRGHYGIRFQVYGIGHLGANNLNFKQQTEADIYRNCKIAINCSHFSLKRYTSDRMFRIMGSGAFCLTYEFPEMDLEYKRGHHLDSFSNLPELRAKIEHYLANEEQRNIIAQNGHNLVSTYYTWDYRMKKQFLEIIEEVKIF